MKKKLSVLIVDDDPNIGDTLTDVLNAKGYDAGFVTSGREALSIIKKKILTLYFWISGCQE